MKHIIWILLFPLLFTACGSDKQTKPVASGAAGSIKQLPGGVHQ